MMFAPSGLAVIAARCGAAPPPRPVSGVAEIGRRFAAGAVALRAVWPWVVARVRGLRPRRPVWAARPARPRQVRLPRPRPVPVACLPRPGPARLPVKIAGP